MRTFSVLLISLMALAALVAAQDASAPIPAPTATPDPAPAPTTPTVTVTNPPTPINTKGKRTPGRHCRMRSGCADCLAINYCVWSPSTSKCLDKHKATLADDVVHTCDPDVCAKHGGKKAKDLRPADHVAADIANSRGKRVIADAVAVESLPKAKDYKPIRHMSRSGNGRTYSEDAHVVIKPGSRKYLFTSDNNHGPIIRGEAEERRARYLAEKREHARQVYRRNLCRAARGCAPIKPSKKQYRSPEYYPVKNRKREHALLKADAVAFDAQLRRRLEALREKADHSLHSKSGAIAAKRRRLHELLDQVGSAINRVNTEAAQIDRDAQLYDSLSKQVADLEKKVSWTCAAPNSAFLEMGASFDSESDSMNAAEVAADTEHEFSAEGEAEAETQSEIDAAATADAAAEEGNTSESDVAAEAENQVDSESEAEAEDFASADSESENENENESESEEQMSPEQMQEAVSELKVTAAYTNPLY